MSVHYSDDQLTLHHGDALEVAQTMNAGTIDCIVTSPPYYGLRDYGAEGQYGLEPTVDDYIESMRALFSELRRVLADDGTLWLNLGDSYAHSRVSGPQGNGQRAGLRHTAAGVGGTADLPDKNLIGIPWRVAFALQADGWILRNAIVWHKPNAMPESVTDRLSMRHETVFLFSASQRYWFDMDPIREPHREVTIARSNRARLTSYAPPGQNPGKRTETAPNPKGANPGDVWSISTQPFPGAHFATMPVALAERCIQAGCREGGTVLDPFSGSGTTGLAASKHGRKYVGIDINRDYLDLSLRTRLSEPGLDFGGAA